MVPFWGPFSQDYIFISCFCLFTHALPHKSESVTKNISVFFVCFLHPLTCKSLHVFNPISTTAAQSTAVVSMPRSLFMCVCGCLCVSVCLCICVVTLTVYIINEVIKVVRSMKPIYLLQLENKTNNGRLS